MKLSGLVTLVIGFYSSSVTAAGRFHVQDEYHIMKFCSDHLYYCGYNLLDIGSYRPEIIASLAEVGIQSPSDKQIMQSLFYCRDQQSNGIGFEKTCERSCHDGGTGGSDYCDSVGP